MKEQKRWDERFFLKGDSPEACVQVIQQSVFVFLGVGLLQLFVTSSTFYIVPLLILTAILWRWHSRMTSLYLLYFCIGFVMVAITDVVQGTAGHWFNMGVSLIALWSAVRTFDATAKLQNRGVGKPAPELLPRLGRLMLKDRLPLFAPRIAP